jgi:hypothetical protein
MLLGDVETYYADNAWRNRVEGSGATALAFSSQADAADVGREEARQIGSSHIVRDRDGRIVEQTTYSVSGERVG